MREAAVEIQGLSRSFGPVQAVREVSFRVHAGEVVGILGPNGAGKTTTLRMLTGDLEPDAGSVRIQELDRLRSPVEARRRLGYLPEDNPLYEEMRVFDFLAFAHAARGLPRRRRPADLERVITDCGLQEVLDRRIGACSRGYRQRVGLAQALVHDPPVLVLDEPTSGLDPLQAREIRALVAGLGRTRSVLLTSHILPEVEALADRVIVIHRGRILADAPLAELGGGAGGGELRLRVAVAEDEEARLEAVLREAGARAIRECASRLGKAAWEATLPRAVAAELAERLLAAGLRPVELAPVVRSLAERFHALLEEAEGAPGGEA